MDINEKIKNIISIIEKIDFKEISSDEDVDFTYKTGNHNPAEYRLFERYISEYDRIYIKFRKFNKEFIKGEIKEFNTMNIFHLKDDVKCFYLFESDKLIDREYDVIMDGLNIKFKHELRKIKVDILLQ